MRATIRWIGAVLVGCGVCAWRHPAEASAPEVSLTLEPIRYIFVDGDEGKFRAQHWQREGYVGGVREFSLQDTLSDGTEFSGAGHALIDQNDLGGAFSLKKAGLGFIALDYTEFRKYYDNTGGTYHPFTTLSGVDTAQDLHLDIGHLAVETGLALEGWPALSFAYEREFKDGVKSRLTWTSLTEGGTSRNIGPSWQEINEIVDVFALKASHELAGVTLKGEQRWELVRTETLREEQQLSTNATASQRKIRRQDQAPETNLATTTLWAERNFLARKLFTAAAYHYARMSNREFESLLEFNANGVPTNFSNPKQQINARADNRYSTHTWTGNVMATPRSWVSVGAKLKSEVIKRNSNSSYPTDAVPNSSGGSSPNGIIDRTDTSVNDTKAVRWGENFSLRFTGIPRTALYTELDLEQSRILLREDRQSLDGPDAGDGTSANEVFSRETVSKVWRGVWTLGGQITPWSFLNLTTQVRHRQSNIDYDNQRHTDPGASTARSAFFDGQNIATNEFTTRVTLRPARWLRTSVRYQFRDDNYATRTFDSEPIVKTGTVSNIYTYDVVLQPRRDLSTTLSFSRQTAATTTPARLSATANTPTYNADVNTWLFGADYAPTARLTLSGTLQYSQADNFDDFTGNGLPLGVDNRRLDLTTKCVCALSEDTSVNAEYGFYHYQANTNAEVGDYDAHLIQLEFSKKF